MPKRKQDSGHSIITLPLHGNTDGKRWRFVIRNSDGSTAYSSRYVYRSDAEALEAARAWLYGD